VRVLFVINARSGARRRNDLHGVIRENCGGWTYDVQPCGKKEELPALVSQASAAGIEVIFAVGGDGTVHEIGRHLIGTSLALGVLPTGSGNGFARHLGCLCSPRLRSVPVEVCASRPSTRPPSTAAPFSA
jgi:Sphingosine kinase and enzymes related to eukaryotic diacylglycerol kinase